MATLDTGMHTLVDWAKRVDPDGKIAGIAELLNQTNEILDDMLFMEANGPTSHRTTVRTGLPPSYWRLVNQGIEASKSQTAQVDETIGMLENSSQVDKALAELNGNVSQYRFREGLSHLESMSQEMAQTVFYGNSSSSPEEFNGLSVRYSALGTTGSGQNVLNAGGATAAKQSSIWLICWGDNKVHGIFPKGGKTGIEHIDFGLQHIQDVSGDAQVVAREFVGYKERWMWKCGLSVPDWRYAVRIANVEVDKANPDSIISQLSRAVHRIPNMGLGKTGIYMNRGCQTLLDLERRADVRSGGMMYAEVDGKHVPAFRGIPIRTCDALLETEAVVS